ncbi:MAG: EF-P beta-lysylation protein EpmB [Planctomycetaceae bacterium]|nr:EF-P beta-lysylation protein EpmB [Planctomycetaceae bacterium]
MSHTDETELLLGPGPVSVAPLDWHRSLAEAIRDPDELIERLELQDELREPARRAARLFPLMVPINYLDRMRRGDVHDPLLRQVLPLGAEATVVPGFTNDPVGDALARQTAGLLQKYQGRALLIATGTCAIHCRYCFRRHYPYGNEPRRVDEWEPALAAIEADPTLHEIILSGGDPLMLTDSRLAILVGRIAAIPHVTRLRVHTRLPIVLPERVTDALLEILKPASLATIVVVHANHPQELTGTCPAALRRLIDAGLTVLNQAVLLAGVNDSAPVLATLCERLVDLGVMPYYLHQLDRVEGAAHFEVSETVGLSLIETLRQRLPGYAVPRYVREVAGEAAKRPVV